MLERIFKFYGSVTVGKRGQIALPIELRTADEIKPGDKLLVFGEKRKDSSGIFLIKAEILSIIKDEIMNYMKEKFGDTVI